MRTRFLLALLTTFLVSSPVLAEKPQLKPYAAGSPFGGIPPWTPGQDFVGISGGSCRGNCPVYELYVFSDGRVLFRGRKDTGKVGTWTKQVSPEIYGDLVATIVRNRVLDGEIKRGTCLKGRSVLTILRSASDSGDVNTVALNSGCEGYADIAKQIEGQFIDWTGVASWLAAKK